jgi:Glycine rich protein
MGRRLAGALGASLVAAAWSVSTAPAASATPTSSGLPSGGCSRPFDDARVRCLFDATGGLESWVVPTDVSFLRVDAWGAQGGSILRPDGMGVAGGRGSGVSMGVDVSGGETLTVVVGTRGGTAGASTGAAPGGFGGGGAGGRSGGGGGGATTLSDAEGRWIVVGGGGGATTEAQRSDTTGTTADYDVTASRQPNDSLARVAGRAGSQGGPRRDAATCYAGAAVAGGHAPTVRRGRTIARGGDGASGPAGGGGGGWLGGGAGWVGASCDRVAQGAGGTNGTRAGREGFTFSVDPDGKVGDGRLSLEYYEYDVDGAPTVDVDRAVGRVESNHGAAVHLSAVFSESVTGFTGDDVVIAATSSGTPSRVVSEVAPYDGAHYDIAVEGVDATGTVTVSVPAGIATDAQFSANTASTVVSLGSPVEAVGAPRRPESLRWP